MGRRRGHRPLISDPRDIRLFEPILSGSTILTNRRSDELRRNQIPIDCITIYEKAKERIPQWVGKDSKEYGKPYFRNWSGADGYLRAKVDASAEVARRRKRVRDLRKNSHTKQWDLRGANETL